MSFTHMSTFVLVPPRASWNAVCADIFESGEQRAFTSPQYVPPPIHVPETRINVVGPSTFKIEHPEPILTRI